MLLKTVVLLLGIIGAVLAATKYQVKQKSQQPDKSNSNGTSASRDRSSLNSMGEDIRATKKLLNLVDKADNLEVKSTIKTITGTRKARVEQRYMGLRVFGVSTSLEYDEDGIPTGRAFGHVINGINHDIETDKTLLDGEQALQILKDYYHPNITEYTIGKQDYEKIVYLNDKYTAVVCWYVYYVAYSINGQNDSKPIGIIDGNTGEILKSYDGLDKLKVSAATGNSRNGDGPRLLNMHIYEAEPGICYYKSSKAEVMDMESDTIHNKPEFLLRGFPCDATQDGLNFDLTNTAYSPMNEVYLYSMYTHDMFMAYTDEPPLSSGGTTHIIKARAHVNGCFDNAYWDGTHINIGDGCEIFYPLSSIDVIGHEIGHGYTQYNAKLVYQDQSGAIAESFSDMVGETAEYYFNQQNGFGDNDWLIGAHLRVDGEPIRYMADPPLDGVSISNVSDYRTISNIHYSSGIFNKAFYKLATSTGWNIIQAFKTYALANKIYWEMETTFHCAACGVQYAADDLGYNVNDVTNSLKSVGASCDKCFE